MGVLDKFLDAIKLNDDYDEYDDDEFYDDEEDEFTEEKPRKRFFKKLEEDEDYEEPRTVNSFKKVEKVTSKPSSKQSKVAATSSKVTPMRNTKKQGKVMEVCVIKPTNMEDAREIADTLIANCTVVLNLEGLDVDVAQRIIDFTSGSCYSIGGNLQKVSSYIFILTPANVDLTGDYQGILSGAFDIPSIHTEF